MDQSGSWQFLVKRDDLDVAEIRPAPPLRLGQGEVLLALEKFALTSNNVTYARLGNSALPFWHAFPAPDGYGRLPIWGVARVEQSRNPEISAGDRYFGYLPLATHFTLPVASAEYGFIDQLPDRDFLHPWYRRYWRIDETTGFDDVRTLFRPLFPAAFNFAEFLERNSAFGARSVLINCASSKTAIALASQISQRLDVATVGLTSAGNTAFVEGVGSYDVVVPYDQLSNLSISSPIVFGDFTGAAAPICAVYERFAGQLAYTALLGYTHPDTAIEPVELSNPRPEVFFTPVHEDGLLAEQGANSYYGRYHQAEQLFATDAASWLTVRSLRGPDAILEVFHSLVAGEQPPHVANILRPE